MASFVAGLDRGQATLLPECLEDWVDENNSVRAVDVFVEALDLRDLGFDGRSFHTGWTLTGRSCHHSSLLRRDHCRPFSACTSRLSMVFNRDS
jgi:hypothetical protein